MRRRSQHATAPGRLTALGLAAFSVSLAVVITLLVCNLLDLLLGLRHMGTFSIAVWSCLLATGAAAGALAVWLAVTHRRGYLIPDDLVGEVCERLQEGDYEEAQAVCVTRPRGLAPVLFEALDRLRRGRAGVVDAAIGQCNYERRVLDSRAAWLGVLARLTFFFGGLASLVVIMDFLARASVMCGLRAYRPHDALVCFASPLVVSLGIVVPAVAAQWFFSRRAGCLGEEMGAVTVAILDYVLSDPRAVAYAEACERARADPVFRRVRLDEGMRRIEAPGLALEGRVFRRRAFGLGRLALCACVASVVVLGGLSALRLVTAADFIHAALGASFWVVAALGAAGVCLALAAAVIATRGPARGPVARRGGGPAPFDPSRASGSFKRPNDLLRTPALSLSKVSARIEQMAQWLPVIGKTALLVGVLGVVLAMMKEAGAMATVWFWFHLEGLLARSFAPLVLALAVFFFTAVTGRVLRGRAGKLCAEVGASPVTHS